MNELYHYGIPRMRWGERRFQYEDGSLTPEGKVRYGRGGTHINATITPKLLNQLPANNRAANQKRVQNMSEEEIAERSRRLDMEKTLLDKEIQYKKAIGERSVPKYMEYLRDIKDVTSIVAGITSDVSNSVKNVYNIYKPSKNNSNNNNP